MTFLHLSRKAVFSLIIALVAIPALSFAEVTTCAVPSSSVCSPGTLHVYVMVQKNVLTAPDLAPANFTLTLHAQNPASLSFPGSLNGTHLSFVGPYSVEVQPVAHYTPSYSAGCATQITGGNEATCVVTMVPDAYQATSTPLTCAPLNQNIIRGQTVSLVADNGSDTYSWSTQDHQFGSIGRVMNIQPHALGLQTITVTSGTQKAVCTVTVLPSTSEVTGSTGLIMPLLSLTSSYIPSLPNTGFSPVSAAQFAFAIAVLLAVGISVAPYVRKIFSVVLD